MSLQNLVYYYRPKCREQVVFGIGGKGDKDDNTKQAGRWLSLYSTM